MKLQKSEARYQGLVENAPDLIYTVDENGRILSINHYASNLFSLAFPGKTAGEVKPEYLLGHSLYDIFSKEICRVPFGMAKRR